MNDVVLPARRTVVRTVAWTVPVVAAGVSAPAYAASCGSTSYDWRLDWNDSTTSDAYSTAYTRGAVAGGIQTGTATITGPTGSSAMVVTFRSEMFGTMLRDGDNLNMSNLLTPSVTNVGGLNQGPGLNISHATGIPSGRANRQEIQISFNRAVSGLAFVISDTDWSNGGWEDRVELTGTRTATAPNISGAGTSTDPWRATNEGNAGNTSNSRNIAVSFTAPVAANTPIVLTFWNNSGNSNQRIFLSDLTFTASGC